MRQRLLIILMMAGILVSGYLLLKTNDPSSVVCSIGGGCETVLSSQYAKLYGLPVAGLGVFWYLAALVLVWLVYFKRIWAELPLRIWSIGGLAFSLYLLYLEKYQIGAYCTWCLVSLGLVILINGLIFIKKKK
ncbi:MAG: vitamin K epoxide reductase family protein [Candidatus Berkelbacteria bacterium]|nr:vitamin K epoxide reductase family protein [Candidatus Berkelbacteria bacterium]